MWKFIQRTEVIISILVGILTVGGIMSGIIPKILETLSKWVQSINTFLFSSTSIPIIVLIVLGLLAINSVYRFMSWILRSRSNQSIKVPQEPTHEKEFGRYLIRYYIDRESELPVVVHPIVCKDSHNPPGAFQYPFDSRSIYVGCSQNDADKVIIPHGYSTDATVRAYMEQISQAFIHNFREEKLAQKLTRND